MALPTPRASARGHKITGGAVATFEIRPNFEGWERAVADVRKRARNLRPWLLQLLPTLQAMEALQFATQGDYSKVGDLWAEAYSDRYKKWKLHEVSHLHKEELYGLMRNSLLSKDSYTLLEVRRDSLVYGTKARSRDGYLYTVVQQYGGDTRKGIPSKKGRKTKKKPWEERRSEASQEEIPPRPPIVTDIPPQALESLRQSLIGYLQHGVFIQPRV